MDDAQARATLAAMRQRKVDLRKVPFRHSTLSKWRAELVRLRIAGASYRELAVWLRTTKRRKYAATTVRRYLIQLPELQADIEGES